MPKGKAKILPQCRGTFRVAASVHESEGTVGAVTAVVLSAAGVPGHLS
jgi:hypothetical protein